MAQDEDTADLPLLAHLSYPSTGIVVRPQPPMDRGELSLVQLPPGSRGDWWAAAQPSRPLRDYAMALAAFAPDAGVLTMLFRDVQDQLAFEAANLGIEDKFLLNPDSPKH